MSVARVTRPPTNAADHSSRGASGSIKIDKINIGEAFLRTLPSLTIFHFFFLSLSYEEEKKEIGFLS